MGRSRAGLTTTIHAAVNANGNMIMLQLSEGQAGQSLLAEAEERVQRQAVGLVPLQPPLGVDALNVADQHYAEVAPWRQRRVRPAAGRRTDVPVNMASPTTTPASPTADPAADPAADDTCHRQLQVPESGCAAFVNRLLKGVISVRKRIQGPHRGSIQRTGIMERLAHRLEYGRAGRVGSEFRKVVEHHETVHAMALEPR